MENTQVKIEITPLQAFDVVMGAYDAGIITTKPPQLRYVDYCAEIVRKALNDAELAKGNKKEEE